MPGHRNSLQILAILPLSVAFSVEFLSNTHTHTLSLLNTHNFKVYLSLPAQRDLRQAKAHINVLFFTSGIF